ncbi:hypothetical protein M1146_04215 [Patescibacteria group bacterium]|nr:hypothetical protein [Patescibacteria group bacterium]
MEVYEVIARGFILNRLGDLVIQRSHFIDEIIEYFKNDSKALFLAGPFLAGKTNAMYQVSCEISSRNDWTCFYFNADEFPSVQLKYQGLLEKFKKDSRIRQIMEKHSCSPVQAFGKPEAAELGNVLILIDEAQNFCPNSLHVYDPEVPSNADAIAIQKREKEEWDQFVRDIIRNSSHTYILANTSSFELLKYEPTVGSPFDSHVFYAQYFSTSELLSALELIEGKGTSRVPLSQTLILDVLEFLISESSGYPGICGYIFSVLNDIIKQVRSDAYNITRADILRVWRERRWQLLFGYLEISRLKTRIQQEKALDLNEILNSSVILGNEAPCDTSQAWVRIGLRCGVFRVHGENITLSCNLMRSILLKCTKRHLPGEHLDIFHFISLDGLLDLKKLLIYLFQQLHLPFINQTESWIQCSRNQNVKVPTEKLYQFCFYQTLCSLCPNFTDFQPVLEMNRVKGRVDLALLTPKGKYQIELAANVQDHGHHSAESHYDRQVQSYHTQDTIRSAVVIIANYLRNSFSPADLNSNVDYVQVQHLMHNNEVGREFSFVCNVGSAELLNVHFDC